MSHSIVVLISGGGTNLQAILDAIAEGRLPARVSLVVSNRADAGGLDRARTAGVPTAVVDHRNYPDRETFDQALIETIDPAEPDTVALAGFMRILTPTFVAHYRGRLLNIHPSLLPRHRGLHTHARALEQGDQEHGCSVHFVTEELDGGPLVAQAAVPVHANDTEASLSKRVGEREHELYPRVLRWRAEDRLRLTESGAVLDGALLGSGGLQMTADSL
jgi:phosphoribosylglycinamide formyltransferase-1